MMDQKKHEGISIREKLLQLMEPSNLIKLVSVQQDELKRMNGKKMRTKYVTYIESLYEHYIVQKNPKTYLC